MHLGVTIRRESYLCSATNTNSLASWWRIFTNSLAGEKRLYYKFACMRNRIAAVFNFAFAGRALGRGEKDCRAECLALAGLPRDY